LECAVSSQTSCSTFQNYNTSGFNNGVWEIHTCSYAGWTWDNCYNRPKAIMFTDVVANEQTDWAAIKAMYR